MVENVKMPDFSVKPQNPLNTRLVDLIGERFIQKCGQTEREKEETSLTESANIESLTGLKYVASSSPPIGVLLVSTCCSH